MTRDPDPTPGEQRPAPTRPGSDSPAPGESCDVCGSPELSWRSCKLICRNCRAIVKSCADL